MSSASLVSGTCLRIKLRSPGRSLSNASEMSWSCSAIVQLPGTWFIYRSRRVARENILLRPTFVLPVRKAEARPDLQHNYFVFVVPIGGGTISQSLHPKEFCHMRRAIACFTLLASTAYAVNTGEITLRGYTSEHATAEVQWEQKFRAIPEPAKVRENMRRMAARPHHVGSPYDKDNAEWLLAQLKSYGLDAKIETFEALFPTPKSRKLELLGPEKFEAKLDEPVVKVDPTSDQKSEQLPTYNAYSRDGDVTGPLVYVNYGAPADYEELARMGVSVKGAIVIARYGQTWRGIKPKVAAEHGAIGCIIYSDPRDDGYFRGDVFPQGPMRNPNGVQRGSVLDMPLYPGDPLTPGVGASGNVKRYSVNEAPTITKIPVLPISYGDAQPLLAALGGPVAPKEFRGALPITYHVGPGPAKV